MSKYIQRTSDEKKTIGLCVVLAIGTAVAFVACESSCTPAQDAQWTRVEQTILSDISAGDGIEKIESDVASVFVGASGPLIVTIIDDALTFLEDTGAIAMADGPHETMVHSQVRVMAHK